MSSSVKLVNEDVSFAIPKKFSHTQSHCDSALGSISIYQLI